jgi:hypothetical protein
MLRRLMAGITAGKPNLEEMNPQLAAAIRKDLPKRQVKLADLGPVESIQLVRVTRPAPRRMWLGSGRRAQCFYSGSA